MKKFKKLKNKFKKLRRKSVQKFHSEFLSELKQTNPAKWYEMARKIGAIYDNYDGDIKVDTLLQYSNTQAAQKIGEHFAKISHEYNPINYSKLPCYLPAPKPPPSGRI